MKTYPDRLLEIARHRVRSLFARRKVESELDRELSFHLEEQTEEFVAQGMSRKDARLAALRVLGGYSQIQEECRDMRRTNLIETIWNDLDYALRTLRRNPGFTATIVLTMALGIGANSAIFSVVEGVLLRPLPYNEPDRIVRIFTNSDEYPKFPLNPNDFRDFRDRNKSFAEMAAITRADTQLTGAGEPLLLRSFRVTSEYFKVLGFSPARGREFTRDDETPATSNVAILSDRIWRKVFGADPNIIGRTITLNADSYQIVGLMPPGVQHPGNDYHAISDGDTVDVWCPFPFQGDPNQRGSHFMEGIGRLKPGITPEQANADLSSIFTELANEHPGDKGWRVNLVPLYRETVGSTQRLLLVLLGAVGLLLLIACVNAANLLLARSNSRQREIAVRVALGAGRGRIVRQLLTESILVALLGAALGTLLAVGGVRLLVSLLPPGFPRASSIKLDPLMFAFTIAVAVVTGILFGLVPAITASKTDLQAGLRDGARGSTGGRRQIRLRNVMVAGEIGLASVLLVAAGLMLHTFVNLLKTDPGFRPHQVLTASITLPVKQYSTQEITSRFLADLADRLSALPGVESAGVGTDIPWTGYDENVGGFNVEGRDQAYNDKTTARFHSASADYFRALGIPLLRGRSFNDSDNADAPLAVMVNETFARLYWPGEDAIGKRFAFEDHPQEKDWFHVVGIVGDVRDKPESTDVHPAFWWPVTQMAFNDTSASVVIRGQADTSSLAEGLRQTVRQMDGGLAVFDVRLMNQITDESVSRQRFALFLVTLFAVLALILAAIGMYGVISYSVNQRMHEFGVRMALGARPRDLVGMILRQGIQLAVAGAVIGLLLAAMFSRLMKSLLYEVSGVDPVTFVVVGALALVTATIACYLPARRATRADPSQSLRAE